MFGNILSNTTIPLLEKVAAFGQRRHTVIAGNIANIDTPDYRMRDFSMEDFDAALQKAVARRRSPPTQMEASQSDSLNPLSGNLQWPLMSNAPNASTQTLDDLFNEELQTAQDIESRNVTFHDGGNRSIEKQMMEMRKNSAMQQFAIETMVAQMRMLEAVISERP